MLNLNSLLLPGESPEMLLDIQQEWYAACDPAEPVHRARINGAIKADLLYRRADAKLNELRVPPHRPLDTPELLALAEHRGHMLHVVRRCKRLLGYSTRRAKLRKVFADGEDFDDIHLTAA
jgi:hypothetical protein